MSSSGAGLIAQTQTNIGPVLLSVNPFKRLPITGQDYVDKYRGKYRHELPPHIYALAEEAYRAVKNDRENQCVIIRCVPPSDKLMLRCISLTRARTVVSLALVRPRRPS